MLYSQINNDHMLKYHFCSPYLFMSFNLISLDKLTVYFLLQTEVSVIKFDVRFWFHSSGKRRQLPKLWVELDVSSMLRIPTDRVSVSLKRVTGRLHCTLLPQCSGSVWPLYHSPRYTLIVTCTYAILRQFYFNYLQGACIAALNYFLCKQIRFRIIRIFIMHLKIIRG